MSDTGTDVVVVGGGIVGTAAAAFLAAAGATVTLVEGDGLASGASGANSGVVQHPFDPVLAGLYRETVGLYRDLSAADLGFRLPDEPAGLLYLSTDDAAVRAVDRRVAEAFPELDRSVVSGLALERVEPAVAGGLSACRVGIGFPVHPGASTYAYATLAEQRGARVRLGRTATLDLAGDEVVGVVVDDRPLACDMVLVAAGPWSSALVDPSGRWSPISRRWGVVVEAELAHGPSHVLEEADITASIGVGEELAVPSAADPDEHVTDGVDFSFVPLPGVASVGSTFLPEQPDPARLDRADPPSRRDVRARRRRRPDPRDALVRAAAERRRPTAHRRRAGPAPPVHLRGPRGVGHLDRTGLGAHGRRPDAGAGTGHPGRPGSGPLRDARLTPMPRYDRRRRS